jgi:hypothetical protein
MEIALDIPLDQVASPLIQHFHNYWEAKKQGRDLPSWDDINPAELRGLLPNMLAVTVEHDPFRIFYRLVGTRIVQFRNELTGRYLDEIAEFPAEIRDGLVREYQLVCTRRAPTFSRDILLTRYGNSITFYGAIFPLSSDGVMVDRCVAVEDFEGQHPDDLAPTETDRGYGRRR